MSLTLSIFTSLNQVSYENEIIMVQSKNFFVARRLKPLTPDDLPWIKTFWLLSKIEGPINRESYDGITEKQEAKNLFAFGIPKASPSFSKCIHGPSCQFP